MKEIIKKIEDAANELKAKIIENLDSLIYLGKTKYSAEYKIKIDDEDYGFDIWIANGKDDAKLVNTRISDLPDLAKAVRLFELNYTNEEKEKLWNKATKDIENH